MCTLTFKPVTLEDRDILTPYFEKTSWRDCNGSFASLYLWSKEYPALYAIVKDMAVVCYPHPTICSYYLPIGDGSSGRLREVLEVMLAHAKEQGTPLRLHLTSEDLENVKNILPHLENIQWKRELADYIYPAEKLRTLSGKKLHSKKNHLNRFMAENEWSFEEINAGNKAECLAMLEEWEAQNRYGDSRDNGLEAEHQAVRRALELLEELRLSGGLIRLLSGERAGRVIAFSIGEALTRDTFVMHFEKAFGEINGAYAAINQQMVEHFARDFTYVNREDDAGDEGLRKAKLSYQPEFLLEKGALQVTELL